MDDLSNDLLLLAVRADGTLALPAKLRFGVAGSELVRLAAAGRVDIVRGRIVVRDTTSTGDPLLDEALASVSGASVSGASVSGASVSGASVSGGGREPTAKAWVARNRPGLVGRYLARAEAAGIIRADRRKALGFIPVTRWMVLDGPRAAQARARLVAAAEGTSPLDPAQAALAGLASAIDVTRVVFPGRDGAAARKRLRQAAKREPVAADATQAVADAALSASVDAAVDAAVAAATQAATEAAHQAGGHGGGGGGHH
jgi:Golgi phosphoprotein 3 (GPP34)